MEHPFEVDEDMVDRAAGVVRELRMRTGLDGVATVEFVRKPLGTEWTVAHTGTPVDNHVGRATTQTGKDLCDHFQMRTQFGCTVAYGENTCVKLCCAWVHRMQWMLDTYEEHGAGDWVFTPAVLATYAEPEGFAAWAATVEPRSGPGERLRTLRAVAPGNRPRRQ